MCRSGFAWPGFITMRSLLLSIVRLYSGSQIVWTQAVRRSVSGLLQLCGIIRSHFKLFCGVDCGVFGPDDASGRVIFWKECASGLIPPA